MNHRKWAAAAVAAAVGLGLLGTALPASADNEQEPTAAIIINGESVAGRTFSAVRIATYDNVTTKTDGDGSTVVSGFDLITIENTAFQDALTAEIQEIDDDAEASMDGLDPLDWVAKQWTATQEKDPWQNTYADNSNVRELANWLETKANSTAADTNGMTPFQSWGLSPTQYGPAEGTSITLNVNEGLYFVWDTTTSASDPGTNSLAMIVGTTIDDLNLESETLGQINVKGDLVPITKTSDVWTAADGAAVTFTITTRVPNYPDTYTSPQFQITDEHSEDLAVTLGSLTVNGIPSTLANVKDEDGTLTIKLTDTEIDSLQGEPLVITYSAKMPTGTFTSETSNSAVTNNATVTFTNAWNGSKESVGTATAAPVTIYSYPLNVIKTDLLSPGGENYLKATFAVSASTSDGKKGEPVGTVTTDESSTGGFIGLAANTWYLVEESDAPDDYTDANLDVAKFWVYIKAEEGNPTSTPAYYFYGGSEVPDDFLTNPGNAKIESAYVNPSVNFWDDTVEDVKKDAIDNMSVLVLNAKSRSDMPSTGGRILLWAGIAAALGLGAVGFGIAGVRRSRNKAAQAA